MEDEETRKARRQERPLYDATASNELILESATFRINGIVKSINDVSVVLGMVDVGMMLEKQMMAMQEAVHLAKNIITEDWYFYNNNPTTFQGEKSQAPSYPKTVHG